MACLGQQQLQLQLNLRCPPLAKLQPSSQPSRRRYPRVVSAVAVNNKETRQRLKLKQLFQEAYHRCLTAPMDGVPFTLQDFLTALHKYDSNSQIGAKVKGTVFSTDANGALVDVPAKSSAYLPLQEACIYKLKNFAEAGIFPGLTDEFIIIGENEADDSLTLSLRANQTELAWERCRQLQAQNIVVNGKVVGANKGGVVVEVEGLRGFVPFSQISSKATSEELMGKEIPLKFVEVDQELCRLVFSNRKAMTDSHSQLGIGMVVPGTVQCLKPYGAFIDIGGLSGLIHVMILSHDLERGRVSLSTKKLEPTPGDMIRNPKLVFEKAEEMAQTFRQRIAQAEALARADLLGFQPESALALSPDGILGALSDDVPDDGLDLNAPPILSEIHDLNLNCIFAECK